jgi:deoxycytidine triphosphate deaminase
MILSAQSIEFLCTNTDPMILPFSPKKRVINGLSAGLSGHSYDLTIADDLVLGVHPGFVIEQHILYQGFDNVHDLQLRLKNNRDPYSLSFAAEYLRLPAHVGAYVKDKSSRARTFLSVFNTLTDAGFYGYLTLELVNHSREPIIFKKGDPVCQIVFHRLDEPTRLPYVGKYLGQEAAPVGPRLELPDGSWRPAA